jgi:hypothetical protein
VQRDRLASLFSLLERRAPGHRPYLLVLGLEGHIRRSEGKQYKADMRAAGGSQVCSAVVGAGAGVDTYVCGRFSGVWGGNGMGALVGQHMLVVPLRVVLCSCPSKCSATSACLHRHPP